MSAHSVGTRFLYSVGANGLRALFSVLTGLMIARALSPHGYGDLTYLLSSFVAIRALLDLGSSSAFFTFMSQQPRDRRFYLLYLGWLSLQLAVSVALVGLILPQNVLDGIWLGQPRDAILLALIATFMQQQVWTAITQIGEAARLTVRVQSIGLGVAVTHLLVVVGLTQLGLLGVKTVLLAIFAELVAAALVASRVLRVPLASEPDSRGTREVLGAYWRFCRPLILVALVGFAYDFADKWLLQRFGGSGQQGYYQIAAQLAAVSLLATTSILSIFWKEIAEANARQDHARLSMLYTRVNRGLLMLGAAVSGLLIPWASQLVSLLLGAEYRDSWPIFALMLLYPIHQSMGQVNATMFMASERTQAYMTVSVAGQLVSLPITFILLAPAEGYLLPGLALGAMGLALKMVVMNALLVNVQAKLIAVSHGWKYSFGWQLAGIGGMVAMGYGARAVALWLVPDAITAQPLAFIAGLAISGLLYAIGLITFVRACPWLIGYGRDELRALVQRVLTLRFA